MEKTLFGIHGKGGAGVPAGIGRNEKVFRIKWYYVCRFFHKVCLIVRSRQKGGKFFRRVG